MRAVGATGWAFASRDLFKATLCEHCVRLSMAVAAGVPAVVARVAPFVEDLGTKLPIIQGNQREAAVFQQLAASLPPGDFVNLDGAPKQQTLETLRSGVPVIAQAYLSTQFDGFEWSGYPDLLVRDGYTIGMADDGGIYAVQEAPLVQPARYQAWDVKNSSKPDPKYQIQVATYRAALQQLGIQSDQDFGIVLGFMRGIHRYGVEQSMLRLTDALASLTAVLRQVTPSEITEGFVTEWSCPKAGICKDAYCDYPGLCKSVFKSRDVLEQLPGLHHKHGPKLRAAGLQTIQALADQPSLDWIDGIKPESARRYHGAARAILAQRQSGRALLSTIAGAPVLPSPSPADLYFDIEWFNPVDQTAELIFMFGAVDANEEFHVFTCLDREGEAKAFDDFVSYAMGKLESDPEMHIYHFSDPEPGKMRGLVDRYQGRNRQQVEALVARMFDLRRVVEASFIPGGASYSLKKLEQYYDADSKLNRNQLVAGGADAMYEFYRCLEQQALGKVAAADSIMAGIAAYNRDDCLSTKLLADWLRGIHFESDQQLVVF